MNASRRKLVLRKESLSRLTSGELEAVVGGMVEGIITLQALECDLPAIGTANCGCTNGAQCTAGDPCIVVCPSAAACF